MLIQDTIRQERAAKALAIEQYAAQVNSWTRDTLARGTVSLGDYANTLINPQRQMGHMMYPTQLERIVAAMGPSLMTEVHPHNSARKCIYVVRSDGAREFISAYENGPMPEYSIFTAHYEWVPDLDYLGSAGDSPKVIERKDAHGAPVSNQVAHELLKKLGPAGALAELRKRASDSLDPENRPGMTKVLKLGAEGIRGWRTHLVYIVQHQAATLGDLARALCAENLPAYVDNASWALGTGARQEQLAW